jgi:hypothetical protein
MSQETETTTASAATHSTENALQSPFCRELRSKKYYFLQQMPTEEAHLLDGSNYCWCRRTMQVIGPDGQQVRPSECAAGRACYKSLFEG